MIIQAPDGHGVPDLGVLEATACSGFGACSKKFISSAAAWKQFYQEANYQVLGTGLASRDAAAEPAEQPRESRATGFVRAGANALPWRMMLLGMGCCFARRRCKWSGSWGHGSFHNYPEAMRPKQVADPQPWLAGQGAREATGWSASPDSSKCARGCLDPIS